MRTLPILLCLLFLFSPTLAEEKGETITTPSGLKYQIRQEGDGEVVTAGDKVKMH